MTTFDMLSFVTIHYFSRESPLRKFAWTSISSWKWLVNFIGRWRSIFSTMRGCSNRINIWNCKYFSVASCFGTLTVLTLFLLIQNLVCIHVCFYQVVVYLSGTSLINWMWLRNLLFSMTAPTLVSLWITFFGMYRCRPLVKVWIWRCSCYARGIMLTFLRSLLGPIHFRFRRFRFLKLSRVYDTFWDIYNIK